MQLLWYKWVIRWDLQRQLAFFRAIGRKLERLTRFVPQGDLGLGSQEWGRWIRDHAKQLLIGLATLCGLVLLWFFRFRLRWPLSKRSRHGSRKAGRREKRIARSVYDRLLRAARRRGIAVTEATSARGLIRALREQSPYAAEQAIPIVQLYEETVFGELPLDPQRLNACGEHLSALKKRRGRWPSR